MAHGATRPEVSRSEAGVRACVIASCSYRINRQHTGRFKLRRLGDVEALTADWVHWYNTSRLMHRLGRIPPGEYEQAYYGRDTAQSAAAHP